MSTSSLLAAALVAAALGLASPQDEPTPPTAPRTPAEVEAFETRTRKMRDGVTMTADFYSVEAYDAAVAAAAAADDDVGGKEGEAGAGAEQRAARRPWGVVVALHQDRASRGEYRPIAPELNRLGLAVLAVDLRAGGKRFRVDNETAKSFAEEIGGVVKPKDAYDDVEFAMRWARELQSDGPLILFGSASSAALALVYAAREKDVVDAVFCFSPGEYLHPWAVVQEEAGKLTIPVYATCGPGTKESTWAGQAVALIDRKFVTTFFPTRDVPSLHGVQTLLAGDAENRERQWAPVRRVLETLRDGR